MAYQVDKREFKWVRGLKDSPSRLVGKSIMPSLTRANGSLIRGKSLQVTSVNPNKGKKREKKARRTRRTFDFFSGPVSTNVRSGHYFYSGASSINDVSRQGLVRSTYYGA